MKKVYVACGGAVATSTVAADKVRELFKNKGLQVEVLQCRISELDSIVDQADLIITTARIRKNYPIPVLHGVAFISGVNEEQLQQQIIEVIS